MRLQLSTLLLLSILRITSTLEVTSPITKEYFTPTSIVYNTVFQDITSTLHFVPQGQLPIEYKNGSILMLDIPLFNEANANSLDKYI